MVLSGATAPQILQRIETGASFDVVIAPPAVLDEIERAARFVTSRAQRIVIGRVGVGVGVGVGVRAGVPLPDLTDAHALRRELLAADSLVFNRASTGRYFETVLKTLGVETAVLTKTTRYPDGASVMAHGLKGSGRELGFGAITEIVLLSEQGLRLAGPLPAGLQNFTTYAAAAMTGPALGAGERRHNGLARASARAGHASRIRARGHRWRRLRLGAALDAPRLQNSTYSWRSTHRARCLRHGVRRVNTIDLFSLRTSAFSAPLRWRV